MENSILTRDELESIRLIDFEKIGQNKAGKEMKVSQTNFFSDFKECERKISRCSC